MLTIPYSVKLLSSLLCTESFRNTRNCSKPWSTQKGHSFPQRFSGGTKEYTFSHGTEHTQSVWLMAVPQSDFKAWAYSLTHRHTYAHTKCWYTFCYLVSKFLNFIYWITRLNRQEVTEPQVTLVHSINSHNLHERFSFKNSYAYLDSGYTQSVWNGG
jgi:hypothetical protein